ARVPRLWTISSREQFCTDFQLHFSEQNHSIPKQSAQVFRFNFLLIEQPQAAPKQASDEGSVYAH
ncbi:MAG: hypothetical protein WA406_15780, partial [Pseudolabrys sp.]